MLPNSSPASDLYLMTLKPLCHLRTSEMNTNNTTKASSMRHKQNLTSLIAKTSMIIRHSDMKLQSFLLIFECFNSYTNGQKIGLILMLFSNTLYLLNLTKIKNMFINKKWAYFNTLCNIKFLIKEFLSHPLISYYKV